MTTNFNHASAEGSRTNEFVGSALTGVLLFLFGVVSVISAVSLFHA
jgi:hypothetical protein